VTGVNNTSPCDTGGQESTNSNVVMGIPSVIVDDTNLNNVTIVGTWISGNTGYAYYGTNYLEDGDTGNVGGKSVTFTPELPVTGLYDVYMRWTTGTNRATNAPIQIVDATGATNTLYANEQLSDGVWWVYLGTYNFNAGNTGSVTILDNGANGYVIANATEFVYTAPLLLQASQSANAAQFSLQSVSGRHYQLQRSVSLTAPVWQDIGTAQAGTGNVLTFVDNGGSSGNPEFYRVEVSL
jgi:hypothetical protein